jgi:multiple sugar transport system substrate-binding protein
MKKLSRFLLLFLVLVLAVSACQPQPPQVKEVVVTKEVMVPQEVIVTKEVTVEKQVVVTPTAAPTGPVKIKIWNFLVPGDYPQPMPLYEEKIKEFEDAHPGLEVEWVALPYEGSDAKLTSAFAGRADAPDIWIGKVPYFAGGLGVADPAPEAVAKCWDENAVDVIKPYLKYEDQYYGFPIESDLGMMLYYNKAMFKEAGLDPEKPPKTMDELLDYAQKLTKADGSQIGFGVRYSGNARGVADKWLPFLHAFGGRLYAEDESTSDGYLNSPEAIEALQFYGDLVNKYKVASITAGKPDDAFLEKRAAMIMREAWMVGLIRDSAPDIEYGVAPLPEKTANPGLSLLFQDGYMVYKFSPNKDLAWELVNKLTCDEALSLAQAKAMGNLPTFQGLFYSDPYITERLDYAAEKETLENPASPYYGHPYINEISFRVGQAVGEVLFGLKTAEQALNDAVADVDEILAKTAD